VVKYKSLTYKRVHQDSELLITSSLRDSFRCLCYPKLHQPTLRLHGHCTSDTLGTEHCWPRSNALLSAWDWCSCFLVL